MMITRVLLFYNYIIISNNQNVLIFFHRCYTRCKIIRDFVLLLYCTLHAGLKTITMICVIRSFLQTVVSSP